MENLPETYQGMIDYVRAAEKQIIRNAKNTKDLLEDIETLKPKIKTIEDQL